MQYEQRESGIVVPKEKPEKPKRKYGVLEIQDEKRRELATEALSKLWDALELSDGRGYIGEDRARYDIYYKLYRFIGEMSLGEDCPEKEVKT